MLSSMTTVKPQAPGAYMPPGGIYTHCYGASQICGMAARPAGTQNRRMTAPAPLEVYRQFQSFLINGEYGRLR
jgi:hypothetical protein